MKELFYRCLLADIITALVIWESSAGVGVARWFCRVFYVNWSGMELYNAIASHALVNNEQYGGVMRN